jgi:short-subunit dehydrogenase
MGKMDNVSSAKFVEKYGPWALVAGASEGLGAAFAREIAARGLNLVLVARRENALRELAHEICAAHRVEVRIVAVDLADPDLLAPIRAATEGLTIGLLVYNAAFSEIGRFFDQGIEGKLKTLDVNCRAPLLLTDALGRAMVARRRGGILLMSSLAGFQGSAMVSVYAATKAFNTVLGEGLWDELRAHGVDVVPFCAGATATPNFLRSEPNDTGRFAPPLMSPESVAREALASLGRGPRAVAGRANRFALFVMERLLARKKRIEIMGRATRKMYARKPASPDAKAG